MTTANNILENKGKISEVAVSFPPGTLFNGQSEGCRYAGRTTGWIIQTDWGKPALSVAVDPLPFSRLTDFGVDPEADIFTVIDVRQIPGLARG